MDISTVVVFVYDIIYIYAALIGQPQNHDNTH